jgi:hypothetical protein
MSEATSGNIGAAIYSSSGVLVAQSSSIPYTAFSAQWYSIPVSATLAATTSYYICYWPSTQETLYYTSTELAQYYNAAYGATGYTGMFPTPVTLTGGTHYGLSLYITATPN